MKIFENFRSAADKCGEELTREMLSVGIPDKYILAACGFHHEANGKRNDILAVQLRQWISFVVPSNKAIDENKLSYNDENNSKLLNVKPPFSHPHTDLCR